MQGGLGLRGPSRHEGLECAAQGVPGPGHPGLQRQSTDKAPESPRVGGQLCWEVGQEEREADPGSVSGVVTVTKAPSVVRRGQKPEGAG